MGKNKLDLEGRVAIITGAGQGIGAAIAKVFGEHGAKVVLADMHQGNLEYQVKRIQDQFTTEERVLGLRTDVTKAEELSALVSETCERFGTVDILVNNAGIAKGTRIEGISKEEWDQVLDVNINGVFLCTQAVLPIMKRNQYGRIINMASIAGRSVSTIGGAHYTTSKAAVLGFTRAVAKETGGWGITVNAVCPGFIDTEMSRLHCSPEQTQAYVSTYPIPRVGQPGEVADTVLFLASDSASYITGAAIDVNGGDLMI